MEKRLNHVNTLIGLILGLAIHYTEAEGLL